jgi:hypothetical protein
MGWAGNHANDARETQLRALFELQPGSTNGLGTDAVDERGTKFELKSTTRKERKISTSRTVGFSHLERWRDNLHWICSAGTCDSAGTFQPGETYYLSPAAMATWLWCNVESKLRKYEPLISKTLALCATNGFTPEDMKSLQKIFDVGTRIQTCYLEWTYVTAHGTRIDSDHAATLRKLVSAPQDNH